MDPDWTWAGARQQINTYICITPTFSFYKRELRVSNYLTIIIVFLMTDTHRSLSLVISVISVPGLLCPLCGDEDRSPGQTMPAVTHRGSQEAVRDHTETENQNHFTPSCDVFFCVNYASHIVNAMLQHQQKPLIRVCLNVCLFV